MGFRQESPYSTKFRRLRFAACDVLVDAFKRIHCAPRSLPRRTNDDDDKLHEQNASLTIERLYRTTDKRRTGTETSMPRVISNRQHAAVDYVINRPIMYEVGKNMMERMQHSERTAETREMTDMVTATGRGRVSLLAKAPLPRRFDQTRSTQPCIPSGSLNRVAASAGVKAGKSPLPSGR